MDYRFQHSNTLAGIGLWVVSFLVLTVLGCSTSSNEGDTGEQPSRLNLRAVFANQVETTVPLGDLRCVVLQVTADDLESPIIRPQAFTTLPDSVVFEELVPVGDARTFTVEAFSDAQACQTNTAFAEFIPTFRGEAPNVNIPSTGATVRVTMELLEAPEIRDITPPDVDEGTPVDLPIVAGNPTGEPVICSATNLPPDLQIDPATCRITGTLNNTAAGSYDVTITVTSGTEQARETFTWVISNPPPVANAGPDQTVSVQTSVQLDGSRSSDVDGDALTYRWALTTRPLGSEAVLSDATLVNPTFVVDAPGTYVVQLIVNDSTVDSTADTVTISTRNSAPVANAGPDQTVFVETTVQLDGSRSSDVDGDALTFRWALTTRPPGSAATLQALRWSTPLLWSMRRAPMWCSSLLMTALLTAQPIRSPSRPSTPHLWPMPARIRRSLCKPQYSSMAVARAMWMAIHSPSAGP